MGPAGYDWLAASPPLCRIGQLSCQCAGTLSSAPLMLYCGSVSASLSLLVSAFGKTQTAAVHQLALMRETVWVENIGRPQLTERIKTSIRRCLGESNNLLYTRQLPGC